MGRDDKRRNGNCLNGEKFFAKKKKERKKVRKKKNMNKINIFQIFKR